jgi:N-acetylmuramoyl-L-alanine amidase
MQLGQNFFHKTFASASLCFVLAGAGICAAEPRAAEATTGATVRKQAASSQYAKAEEQRAILNSKAAEKRTLADYKQVVTSYRRVALITPRAPEVPDSLLAAAELYTEMGDRFGKSYYQSAVDSYQFLIREYPGSKYCQDAMLRVAKLQKDQLGDPAQARKSYEDFLKKYPHSARKREVQESLAELALLQDSDSPAMAASKAPEAATVTTTATEPAPAEMRRGTPAHSGGRVAESNGSSGAPRVRRIRASANGDATRVTIDLEDSVQYMSARIAHPDRIFFDLHAARLTPEVARGSIHVEGNLLTAVRVAQNHAGVVRVVLDVNGVKDYTASLSNDPPQLLIDLYPDAMPRAAVKTANARKSPAAPAASDSAENAVEVIHAEPLPVAKTTPKNAASEATPATESAASGGGAIGGSVANGGSTMVARSVPALQQLPNTLPSAKGARSKSLKNASTKPDLVQPPSPPQPLRDGQSTLTRTLGLKIGRIVIDPGHGGHDTGTIGPTGLMEKDLCLDVALRLGKLIEQKLPGANVVYTRADDTFIPLEERTNIANQAKADLFISIHANSSQDHGARGIETYYLNLKGSAEAMEVAARENAASQQGIHDLQDMVKRIAQTEKIDESREFATDIQDSLAKRIQKNTKTVKNRGVRKAPFVVLIGADMPSILTEISFLSNPADEQMLKKPEQRQRVAEGLLQGVTSYLQNLNSVTINSGAKPPLGRSAGQPVEQSRNQN